MKKYLILVLAMAFIFVGIGPVLAVTVGTAPEITVNSINYADRFGNPVAHPFYNGDKIYASVNVNDLQGWSDIKYVRIYFNSAYGSCSWGTVISAKERTYNCVFMVPPSLQGSYESSILAVDKAGLSDEIAIDNFYFNPVLISTHDSIAFVPEIPVMGQVSETPWINVKVDSPTEDNPYDVVLYGNNLYEDTSTCPTVNVCTKYEKKCEVKVTYVNKTVTNCSKVYYVKNGKTYSKQVCTHSKVLVPKSTTVCGYTDNCLLFKAKVQCASHTNICDSSNTMELENFKYMIQGEDIWKDLSYSGLNVFHGEGSQEFNIKFKVDVPDVCYGNYILDGRNIKLYTRI